MGDALTTLSLPRGEETDRSAIRRPEGKDGLLSPPHRRTARARPCSRTHNPVHAVRLVRGERESGDRRERVPCPRRSRRGRGSWRWAAAEDRCAAREGRDLAVDDASIPEHGEHQARGGEEPRRAVRSAGGAPERAERQAATPTGRPGSPGAGAPRRARSASGLPDPSRDTSRTTRSRAGGAHRLERRDRRRLLLHDRRDQRRLARSRNAFLPGRHLVEHRAEREDVRPRVGLLALELLRRHVLERAEDRAFLRQVGVLRRQRGQPRLRLDRRRHRLRQPEVEQLHARLRQHDVAGLQVPVHDPLPVRLVQCVGDLDAVPQRLLQRQRTLREALAERLPLEQLHHEILGLALPPHVVERADVRMRELRDRLRFPLEALASIRGRHRPFRQHLDRDGALEPRVPRLVDLSHPARANGREDLVRAEARARDQGQPGLSLHPATGYFDVLATKSAMSAFIAFSDGSLTYIMWPAG